jgi:hypothetical protein
VTTPSAGEGRVIKTTHYFVPGSIRGLNAFK